MKWILRPKQVTPTELRDGIWWWRFLNVSDVFRFLITIPLCPSIVLLRLFLTLHLGLISSFSLTSSTNHNSEDKEGFRFSRQQLWRMITFWDTEPCSLVEIDVSEVRTAYTIRAVRISETSVYFNETTRPYIPDRYHLQLPGSFINLCIV
jgi:hypothetical protein